MNVPLQHPDSHRPRCGYLLFIAFAASLLLVFASFHQTRDWNTATRLLLTYAFTQNASIEITPFVTRDGQLLRDPPTRDMSSPGDGRYFCDKAPGHSFLGVPACWIALKTGLIEPYPSGLAARAYWPADYWVTLGTNGLYTALGAVLLTALLQWLGVRPTVALLTGQAWALATIAFPYATLYYGHSTCAFFTLLSVAFLCWWPGRWWACFLSGLATGIAVTIDYPQAVFALAGVVVLGCMGWFRRDSQFGRWDWLWYVLGGLPMAGLLGYYHYLVTGSPFQVPYTMEVEEIFAYHREGIGIPIGVPKPAVVYELLLGQKRGLLWYSPVLLAAAPGLVVLWRRRQRWLAVLATLTFLGLLGINAGFPTWDGGWAVGPRFLLPSFPLLLVAAGVWLNSGSSSNLGRWLNRACKAVWLLAAVTTMVLLTGYAVVGGRVPPNFEHPIREFLLPSLTRPPQSPMGLAPILDSATGLESAYPVWFCVSIFILLTQGGLLFYCHRVSTRCHEAHSPSTASVGSE